MYVLSSGAYGTFSHRVENEIRSKGWRKARYAFSRFLVPFSRKNRKYDIYAGMYPYFYRHRILLPFLPFYRLARAVRTGKLKAEIKAIRNVKPKE